MSELCVVIILLFHLPLIYAVISHRGTLLWMVIIHSCFWWSKIHLSWVTALKSITCLWKKLIRRYAAVKISSYKKPETKLFRQILWTWPDEIKTIALGSSGDQSLHLFWNWSSLWWKSRICRVCEFYLSFISDSCCWSFWTDSDFRLSVILFLSITHLLVYWLFFQERKGDLLWLNCITRDPRLFFWIFLTLSISPWISYQAL